MYTRKLPDPFRSNKKVKSSGGDGVYKFIIFALLAVIIGGGVYFSFIEPNNNSEVLGTQSNKEQEERLNKLVDTLRKKILLPDESPDIATIAKLDELKAQNPSFYENAKEGDLLIIFTNSALIYRESEDLIINLAPVSREQGTETTE